MLNVQFVHNSTVSVLGQRVYAWVWGVAPYIEMQVENRVESQVSVEKALKDTEEYSMFWQVGALSHVHTFRWRDYICYTMPVLPHTRGIESNPSDDYS